MTLEVNMLKKELNCIDSLSNISIDELATEIDSIAFDYDYDNYMDVVEDRLQHINLIKVDLRNKNIIEIESYLKTLVEFCNDEIAKDRINLILKELCKN